MPKTPEKAPLRLPEFTLQNVLDAISMSSAFAMALEDRIDRYHLIETMRSTLGPDSEPRLVRELHARRMETLLSLASFATANPKEFETKAAAIGDDFDYAEGGKLTDQHLIIIMILTALSADGRQHGIELEVSRKTSAKDEVKRPH